MEVMIKKFEKVDIDEATQMEITIKVLKKKFGLDGDFYIEKNGDLIEDGEQRGHFYKNWIRKATEKDKLFFKVMKILRDEK